MTLQAHLITDERAAHWLLNSRRVQWLMKFCPGPRTIPDVAQELDLPHSTLRFWVGRFEKLGLLQRLPENHEVKYQWVSERMVIPLEREVSLEVFHDVFLPYWQQFSQSVVLEGAKTSGEWGILLFRDLHGHPNVAWRPMSQMDGPDLHLDLPGVNHWVQARLSAEQATHFRQEMARLIQEMAEVSKTTQEGTPYLFHLGMIKEHSAGS